MARAITIWKKDHLEHPANLILPKQEELLSDYISKGKPKNIALLLPLTGQYTDGAEIIRDGFLSAYYENNKKNNSKINIHIYDTNNNDLYQIYKDLNSKQVDFIVGPLIKDKVENFAHLAKHNIPILALNTPYPKLKSYNSHVFQFGLVPEVEVTELIEKIWHDGHRKVSIIASAGNWGQRITESFHKEWELLGGIVLTKEEITNKDDLNQKMRRLLSIDTSEQRILNIKILGLSFESKPIRRQDLGCYYNCN